jgi:hypothetical protein
MSIIYDALKKVGGASNNKPVQTQPNKPDKPEENKPPKFKIKKIYFLYLVISCLGVFAANLFLNFLVKAPGVKKQTKVRLPASVTVIAKSEPSVKVSIEESISKKVTEAVSALKGTTKEATPPFVLNGVFYSENEGYALINNQIVKTGDTIEGATVKKINAEEVELEFQGTTIKLKAGK